MKILVLRGGDPSPVCRIVREGGDEVVENQDPITVDFIMTNNIDFIVSHGYRHIIRTPVLEALPDRVVNLHISLLPWNKGADPNLWSFLEDTPKGITIHFVDAGVDTGDILAQKEMQFDDEIETLETTYRALRDELIRLFEKTWPAIKSGTCPRRRQPHGGSIHRSKDKEAFAFLLPHQWGTSVSLLRGKAKR